MWSHGVCVDQCVMLLLPVLAVLMCCCRRGLRRVYAERVEVVSHEAASDRLGSKRQLILQQYVASCSWAKRRLR